MIPHIQDRRELARSRATPADCQPPTPSSTPFLCGVQPLGNGSNDDVTGPAPATPKFVRGHGWPRAERPRCRWLSSGIRRRRRWCCRRGCVSCDACPFRGVPELQPRLQSLTGCTISAAPAPQLPCVAARGAGETAIPSTCRRRSSRATRQPAKLTERTSFAAEVNGGSSDGQTHTPRPVPRLHQAAILHALLPPYLRPHLLRAITAPTPLPAPFHVAQPLQPAPLLPPLGPRGRGRRRRGCGGVPRTSATASMKAWLVAPYHQPHQPTTVSDDAFGMGGAHRAPPPSVRDLRRMLPAPA
jgi:hypothetical protein